MSVGLGTIPAHDGKSAVEVSASNYDSEELVIEQDDAAVVLTRRQIQALSIIFDRFMDR